MQNQTPRSFNPFSTWKKHREERKKELAEQAAMEITNDTAENESKIIGVLERISFINSKLPKEVLEKKSKEDHPCGDLEYARNAIVVYMKKRPLVVSIDIRPIDEKIYQLAEFFEEAIVNGYPKMAEGAKDALRKGIIDIRAKVPSQNNDNARQFINTYVNYLETCITYCEMAKQADTLDQYCENDKVKYDEARGKYQQIIDEHKALINNDTRLQAVFDKLMSSDSRNRSDWDEEERKLHNKLIDLRMEGVTSDFLKLKLQQDELSKEAVSFRMNVLNVKIQNIPVVVDVNLMNKYQEDIDALFMEFSRADTEIDESLKSIDDIEGRIRQLEHAPGAERAREIAVESGKKILDELQKKQDEEAGVTASTKDFYERYGLRSPEQQEQFKAEIAAQNAEAEARNNAAIENLMNDELDNDDSNLLTN